MNKKYLKDNKILLREWNYEKNIGLNPELLMTGSDKKVWWKCKEGHEWETSINKRSRGDSCPYCSGHKVLVGYNDLATTNPILAKEWNYEKNCSLTPKNVTVGSGKKVWWKCKEGHEWEAVISSRNRGTRCPFCSGRQSIIGYNDLATINPTLAKEWNYEKNGDLKPDMVKPNSVKKVWWKCEKGHEWEAVISRRNNGNGCPICARELQTSFPEQAIYFYIKKLFPDAINGDRHLGIELDIYIPSKRFAVEYDGLFWHKDKKRDERKNNICKENKIVLFRVREEIKCDWSENEYLKIVHCTGSDASLEESIKTIVSFLGKNLNVDLNKDRADIYMSFIKGQREQSLQVINQEVVKEWNYEKNGDLKPDMVASNSGKKVWWICKEGHEWLASIYSRTDGAGCPICAGQQTLKGYNDLATINPILAKEWNYEKNGDLKPDMVTANTNKKVWWKCSKCRNEWLANISNRNKGRGCPICSNKQVLKRYNDLATTNPILAKEWNYEKNGDLKPDMVTSGTHQKVWWKCNKGHEWEASIDNRNRGTGCPICENKQILKGYNDLATTNPQLEKEWNYEKNGDLKPDMVASNSGKKVWWICKEGHEWLANISNRNKGRGCPICSNKQVLKGYNDLATTNPILAKEWNYEKNGDLKPDMVTSGTHQKVWWKCNKGHEWEASIDNRNRGTGCPTCKKNYKQITIL